MAFDLIRNRSHVWTNHYSLTNLNLNNFSQIFYSEYAAYADREYLTQKDDWSKLIEGSHCLVCGLSTLLCMIALLFKNFDTFLLMNGIGMGSQFMNSILYMVNYIYQTQDSNSINYNTDSFPTGQFLEKRPFMYVNIFWTIMPLLCIIKILDFIDNNQFNKKINKDSNFLEKIRNEKYVIE